MRGLNTGRSICIRMFCFGCSRPNSFVGTLVRSVCSRPATPEVTAPSNTVVSDYNLRPIPRVSYAEDESDDDLTSNVVGTKVYSMKYVTEDYVD